MSLDTYMGLDIDPFDPAPCGIHIVDIAHALSNICRFAGMTRRFYSVAQHAVLASNLVERPVALAALMHDASEYVLGDVARPLKETSAFDQYVTAEKRLMMVIAGKFGFQWPMPPQVKEVDEMLARTEARDLMPATSTWWRGGPVLPDRIEPWVPEVAEKRFIDRFMELTD